MDLIEQPIHVSWPHRVLFADDVFTPTNRALCELLMLDLVDDLARRVLLVVDEALARARPNFITQVEAYFDSCSPEVLLVAPPILCPGGESAKGSWAPVAEIHHAINQHRIDRHSFLIAIGGGALLDMAGLAAATAHRGVRHVRIPTTTLSQCDSGVGVKNGINAFGKKNYIGTFAPPFAVVNDFKLLATLPPRDLRAGFAEAVKVACIRDRDFFEFLEEDAMGLARFEPVAMRKLIRRCATLHLEHIAANGDPFEFGSARPLDFGHWAAHKLEQMSGFTLRHGEAVAIGIALDVIYSRQAGFLAHYQADRILRLLETLGFVLGNDDLPREELLAGLEEFREHLGGRLAITLLKDIGVSFEVSEMNLEIVHDAVRELARRGTILHPTRSLAPA